ncbi:Cell morphogenesis protein PAG1 [Agyrium rufum]|nr:Cell morphogenesis protein PAG1 [Agyrium rufum]
MSHITPEPRTVNGALYASRGRHPGPVNGLQAQVQSTQRALSPRIQTHGVDPAARVAGSSERRPSGEHNHNRKTSIVHGIAHHSRNSSLNDGSTAPARNGHSGTLLSPETPPQKIGGIDANLDYHSNDSPAQALHGSPYNHSTPSGMQENRNMGEALDSMLTQRRVVEPKAQTGRARREHSRSHSQTKPNPLGDVGEFAMHHLFNSFVTQAEFMMNQCIATPPQQLRVEDICGTGANPDFDQLISALGHIARQRPKLLIDSVMLWRQAKGDAVSVAKAEFNNAKSLGPMSRPLPRRNTEPGNISHNGDRTGGADFPVPMPNVSLLQDLALQADRRSSLSIYLLCRVLIEVYKQSDIKRITIAMADKLETIVFDQLQRTEPDSLPHHPFRLANWLIYSQLLGVMSSVNFLGVSRRFVGVLREYQRDPSVKGASSKDSEDRLELLVLAMRRLHIRIQPEEMWNDSCNFMHTLAEIFVSSHGQPIKAAYCQVLETLVIPVATSATVQLNSPKWRDFLTILNTRLAQMLVKPRYWLDTFPLSTLLLCASPREPFASQWLSAVTSLQVKMKDRQARSCALQAICRMVWTYLNRIIEPTATVIKKLEEVVRIVLPAGKKPFLSTEPAIAEPIIELIRIIGFHHQDFCFRAIVFPLINSELFISGREIRAEQLEPDRISIGIRAFLKVITDLENAERGPPPFPAFDKDFENSEMAKDNTVLAVSNRDTKSGAHVRADVSTTPVQVSKLNEVTRGYYSRFCEILGKITLVCDNTFGGQAALDEKFSSQTPKTPISDSFSFGRKDEHIAAAEHKQGYYDLLHVAVQALPRFFSTHIPFNALVNLLCTGTAHVQSNIAASSAKSLKAIARQSHSQPVTIGFARFIFNFNARYATMSDEGMLGPAHIENTLGLYIELLEIWIEEIKRKTRPRPSIHDLKEESPISGRGLPLDLTNTSSLVDEVESHGIFFLCSQSRPVRHYAVQVLKRITDFDIALGKSYPRIIHILEGDVLKVIDPTDDRLTVAERSRLQKGKRKSAHQNTLIELCSSEVSYDSTLWFKVFPNLIRISFGSCPNSVTLSRDLVCARLLQVQNLIAHLSEGSRHQYTSPYDGASMRTYPSHLGVPKEVLVEQWKLYLIMACTTLTNAGAQTRSQLLNAQQHARNKSKGQSQGGDKITSARSLFAYIIPLLSATPNSIRDAIVAALGSINSVLYRTLLESLQYAVTTCNEEAKVRVGTHQRTGSNPRRNRRTDRLRTEVTHVYKLTSRFLHDKDILQDDWILSNLIKYTDEMRVFLSDTEIQSDWEFQTLRRHYCGLVEEVFEGICRTSDPSRWMSFEARKAAFALMEDWCGYSPNQADISQREDLMRQSAMEQHPEGGDRSMVPAAIEIEKKNLRTAALSAMASLCAGPLTVVVDRNRGTTVGFNVQRMLSWVDQIFDTISDKLHSIGRRALTNLIIHNKDSLRLLEHAIDMCYITQRPKALESYFEVVSQVLIEDVEYPMAFWRILGAVLVTLGNEKSHLRMKSARLLRIMENRQQKSSKLQDFDIRISDKTMVVYKNAQFEISQRLAAQHSELAFYVFSQFSKHFKDAHPDSRRNMIASILPWVQIIELQVDPNGGPTAQSFMLLANLLEITTKATPLFHNEVQALWQALATGPHPGNVQLILDFVITLFLDRREHSFIRYAKQIVVFLSITQAGQKVVDFLLMQITPRNMVHPDKPRLLEIPPDKMGLPYIADIGEALPIGGKQSGFSMGQLSMILLVDLMAAPVKLGPDHVPLLLQVCMILWDHYTLLVQEQAREMLVHLVHELVISKIDDESTNPKKDMIESFIESIRQQEPNVVWAYQDYNGKDDEDEGTRVPASMTYVATELISIFSLTYPNIHEQWAKTSLTWATSCSVRHLACRSFQIFRCIVSSLNTPILSDMLARLSNTIADEAEEVQSFSMEILTTLKTIIAALDPSDLLKYPQLCWATCACLNTVNECEFIESLGMLDKLLDKIDLYNPAIVKVIVDAKPERWEGAFDGLMPLIYKGLKSGNVFVKCLSIINKTVTLPNTEILGDQSRLLFAILANLPGFLHAFETLGPESDVLSIARLLSSAAESEDYPEISMVLNAYANLRYTRSDDFLIQLISTIRHSFFPRYDLKCLVFMMGLLTNRVEWFKLQTMKILCVIVPEIDMRRADIAVYGADMISPLLRLLQTEYCNQSLEVMDRILAMSSAPMDKSLLRMSMASGSRIKHKEFEKVQSLYGIPEDTGWSIPMPAVHSNTTRANVHAVFYTCANQNTSEEAPMTTPEIEFDEDEYQHGSYFVHGEIERHDTMMSEDTRVELIGDTNIEDLESRLDSLDDFFEDSLSPDPKYLSGFSDITITEYDSRTDRSTHMYDQHTAPILDKTLARAASVSSLHNTFQDTRQTPLHRDQSTQAINTEAYSLNKMSSSAIHLPALQTQYLTSQQNIVRPPLHSRSITSPQNVINSNQKTPYRSTPTPTSAASTSNLEMLSDDDTDSTNLTMSSFTFSHNNTASTLHSQHDDLHLQNHSQPPQEIFSEDERTTGGLRRHHQNSLSSPRGNGNGNNISTNNNNNAGGGTAGFGSGGAPILETMIRRTKSTVRKISNAKEYPKRDYLRAARVQQAQGPDSPEVPKVPEAYLMGGGTGMRGRDE